MSGVERLGQLHHVFATRLLSVAEYQVRVCSRLGRGICEVDGPSVARIGAADIFSHRAYQRILPYPDFPFRRHVQQLQVVQQFACRMSPVTGTLVATSVPVGMVDELVHGEHATFYCLSHSCGVRFRQQEALQYPCVAPWIPVVDKSFRSGVKSHPPVVLFQERCQGTSLDFMFQSETDRRVSLVHFLVEEIVQPCQHFTHLNRPQVDDLFPEVR